MTKERFTLGLAREYLVYILVFLVLLVLTLTFLFPQVGNAVVNRLRLEEETRKLESLQNKRVFLQGVDKTANRQKLQRLNLALPTEKDVGLLFAALEQTAARSNVSLGSFSLSVGTFATQSAIPTSPVEIPSLEFNLSLTGETATISKFIGEINKTLPIIEVRSASLGGDNAALSLAYYFKPLISTRPSLTTPLPTTSASQEEIFQKLLERESPFSPEESSPSGEPERVPRENPFR